MRTHEQEAKALVGKFLDLQIHGLSTIKATERAKQCALICVEEMKKEFSKKFAPSSHIAMVYSDKLKELEQLKTAIEEL